MKSKVWLRSITAITGILFLMLVTMGLEGYFYEFDTRAMDQVQARVRQKKDENQKNRESDVWNDNGISGGEAVAERTSNEISNRTSGQTGTTAGQLSEGTDSASNQPSDNTDSIAGQPTLPTEQPPSSSNTPTDQSPGLPNVPDEQPEDTVAGFQKDADGMLIRYTGGQSQDGYIELPSEGYTGIRAGTFSNCGEEIVEVLIPSNYTNIEPGAFRGLDHLERYEMGSNDSGYESVDGILFGGQKSELIAFPSGRTGYYSVPDYVRVIDENAFYATSLTCLDFLECEAVVFAGQPFGPSQGDGLILRTTEDMAAHYRNSLEGSLMTIEVLQYE